MIFTKLRLEGAYLIDIQKIEDERGFFARTFCQREFIKHGLNYHVTQCNISFNKNKGTLRGMHFQAYPNQEAKLVCCSHGAIYDVIIDLRPNSPNYLEHIATTLTSNDRRMLYIPEGFAHGFLTLEDNAIVSYQMSEFYSPESSRGVRWNDPIFNIKWPSEITTISERDSIYPDFSADNLN